MTITIGEPICSRHLDVTSVVSPTHDERSELTRMRKREVCIDPRQEHEGSSTFSGYARRTKFVELNENTPGVREYVLAMKFIRMLTPDGMDPFEYWGEQLRNI